MTHRKLTNQVGKNNFQIPLEHTVVHAVGYFDPKNPVNSKTTRKFPKKNISTDLKVIETGR